MEIELELKLDSLPALVLGLVTGFALGFVAASGGGGVALDRLRGARDRAVERWQHPA